MQLFQHEEGQLFVWIRYRCYTLCYQGNIFFFWDGFKKLTVTRGEPCGYGVENDNYW